MSMQAEAEALVTLLRDFPDAKAWVTFSCKVIKFS
jgi:S-methylmethionine-dependent homocysteine/selenocysteine methylase